MSIYINCSKSGNKKYLQIISATYVKRPDGSSTIKRKILKSLGPLEKFDDGEPDFLNRFREKFNNGELDIEGIEQLQNEKVQQQQLAITLNQEYAYLKPVNLGYFFLNSVFDQLGIAQILTLEKTRSKIEYDLVGLTRLLVFGRILQPDSKISTFYQNDKYIFPVTSSTNEKEMYRALDVLSKCSDKIQNRMNLRITQSSVGRAMDMTYYDVTNYYFETPYNDEDMIKVDNNGNETVSAAYRKKGVNKEKRNQPIVQMGLFIDQNGIPVSFDLFPGNMQDKTTFKEMINSNAKKFDSGKVIIVADNGIYAQENFYLTLTGGNGYIVSKSIKKSWSRMRDIALDEAGYNLITNNMGEVVFKYKALTEDKTFKDKSGNSITKKIKTIIYWSKKQYEKSKRDNQKFIEYLESCKEHPDKLKDKQRKSQDFIKKVQVDKKTGEIVNTKEIIVFLDEKIEKYQETMGYYAIETSEYEMPDREVIDRYHGLSRIEDAFRVIKSDLDGRPIFVRTKEHIKAHFLVCFIALTIIRIWQHKILKHQGKDTLTADGWENGITAETFAKVLNAFNADRLSDEYYKVTKPCEELEELFEIVGSKRNLRFPTEHIIRQMKGDIIRYPL